MAKIIKLEKTPGMAGQVAVSATVDHGEHGGQDVVTFVGSAYGTPGPVVLVSKTFGQTHVTDPGRFGETFGETWVRRFYGEEPSARGKRESSRWTAMGPGSLL